MSGEKWEVVGKKAGKPEKISTVKKPKKSNEKSNKPQPIGTGLEESKTIFEALLDAEEKRDEAILQKLNQTQPERLSLIHNPFKSSLDIQQALNSIDCEELERIFLKEKNLLGSEKSLKKILLLLNLNLSNFQYDDALNHKHDFPICFVSTAVKKSLLEMIAEYSDDHLQQILSDCIDSMYLDQMKGHMAVGLKLFVQVLLKKKPGLVLNNVQHYEVILQKSGKVALKGLCVLWVMAQAGYHSLQHGLLIWTSLMLAYVNVRTYSSFIINYAATLFNLHSNLEPAYGCISKTDYFKIFSEVYSKQSSLPQNVKDQLINIYPKIKAIAWGKKSENLHNFFGGYLQRCVPDCPLQKQQEILNCLVTCLENDTASFDQWVQDYHKTIPQSKMLLSHLLDGASNRLDKRRLHKTAVAMDTTNEQLVGKAISQTPEYQSCRELCQLLINKTKSGFVGKKFFLLLVLVASLTTAHYMYYPSFTDSYIYSKMTELGVNEKLQPILEELSEKINWIRNNSGHVCCLLTPYYTRLGEHVHTALNVSSKYALITGEHVLQIVNDVSFKAYKFGQPLVDQVVTYMPNILELVATYLNMVVHGVLQLADLVLKTSMALSHWLQTNVFVGNLSASNMALAFDGLVGQISNLTLSAQNWIQQLFAK